MNDKNRVFIKKVENGTFVDTRIYSKLANSSAITHDQQSQLKDLANLSDSEVRKQAESDPDCPPLDDKH